MSDDRYPLLLRQTRQEITAGIGRIGGEQRKTEVVADRVVLFVDRAVKVLVDTAGIAQPVAAERARRIVVAVSGHDRHHILQHRGGAAEVLRDVDQKVFDALFRSIVERPFERLHDRVLKIIKHKHSGVAAQEQLCHKAVVALCLLIFPELDVFIGGIMLLAELEQIAEMLFFVLDHLDIGGDRRRVGIGRVVEQCGYRCGKLARLVG